MAHHVSLVCPVEHVVWKLWVVVLLFCCGSACCWPKLVLFLISSFLCGRIQSPPVLCLRTFHTWAVLVADLICLPLPPPQIHSGHCYRSGNYRAFSPCTTVSHTMWGSVLSLGLSSPWLCSVSWWGKDGVREACWHHSSLVVCLSGWQKGGKNRPENQVRNEKGWATRKY